VDINIDSSSLKVMVCGDCKKLQKTAMPKEFYCPIRMAFMPAKTKICKRFEAKPPEPKAEPKPEPKKPESPKVVETEGIFVYVESDEIRGRIIGREGRNVRALEQETNTTINMEGKFFWIGGDSKSDERLTAHILWAITKEQDARLTPEFIHALVERVKTLQNATRHLILGLAKDHLVKVLTGGGK
jgi:hypothetical protein